MNPIKVLVAFISDKTGGFNADLIDINTSNPYEIERQIQIGSAGLEKISGELVRL